MVYYKVSVYTRSLYLVKSPESPELEPV